MLRSGRNPRQTQTESSELAAKKQVEELTELRKIVCDLARRVEVLENVGSFWGDQQGFSFTPEASGRAHRGPAPKIENRELFDRRDSYILGLEEIWPIFAPELLKVKTESRMFDLLATFAPKMPIREAYQKRFAELSSELLDFVGTARFRRKPSARAVRLVLEWRGDIECFKAAAKLPTRQIANALAGVPELKWRTSLDNCVANPSELHVSRAVLAYYRLLYKDSVGC